MRLIDADRMVEEWKKKLKFMGRTPDGAYPVDFEAVIMSVDREPTIEAVPVVHGEWKNGCCTNCGQVDLSKPNFCPNCGADMRKGGAE